VGTSGRGDTLGPLPNLKSAGGGSPFSGSGEKEREKLQKRGSAGRFAGKVASLGVDRSS